jgi:hypothetical protein
MKVCALCPIVIALDIPDTVTRRDAHASQPRPPFAWVGRDHPWAARVDTLRAAIAAGPAEPLPAGVAGPDMLVQAELKGVPDGSGGYRLERAYWSAQRRGPGAAHGLQADTYSADLRDATAPRCEWLRLPKDPYLNEADPWLAATPLGVEVEILRYVPLRRLTLKLHGADGRTRIGKFKRRSRYAQAYGLLGAVARALDREVRERGASPGFELAAPLSLKPRHALYFQSCLSGAALADQIVVGDAATWLFEFGRRQQRLQGLDSRELPARGPQHQLAQARRDLAWIAWFRPAWREALAPLAEAIERLPEWSEQDAGFCHGDLVASQCLVPAGGTQDPTDWGITDFDLAHRGDSCRDLAILIASFEEDLALYADEHAAAPDPEVLAEALLDGVRHESARLGRPAPDARRLCWQRLCAEIYYLGLMLKKDRYRPALAARRLDRARRLAGLPAWS